MNWIQKLWPRQAKAKSKPAGGALVPSYGQDLQHPDELINRANKRAVKGDLEGAIADFDAAIDLNPAKATTFYNRGYLNNVAGNYERALQDCSEAISLLPDYDEAFYQRGVAHQALGDLDAAIVDLSEVLRLNAYSIKAYYKRASCYAAQDDVQGAVADYTQAILRVPKDANAYLQRGIFLTKLQEYQTAVADFSSALSFNPKSADAYYHRGYCYAELGETEKATQDFNQAMLYDPSQRVADYNRSYALGILQNTKNLPPAPDPTISPPSEPTIIDEDEAFVLSLSADSPTILSTEEVPARSQALQEDPSPLMGQPVEEPVDISPPSFSRVEITDGWSSVIGGTVTEAQSSSALVRQSEVEALFATAQHQAKLQDFEAAISTYSEIIESDPSHARAYLERGRSFNAMGQGEEAAADVDTSIRLAKQRSLNLMQDYNSTLAETLADLKGGLEWETHPASTLEPLSDDNHSIEGAILKYSQRIHRNPLDVRAYFERAKSRALLGDLEGAIADYTRTISLDEQYRDAYYRRGMLLSALGDTDGATRDMNKAILRKPMLPMASPSSVSPPEVPSDDEEASPIISAPVVAPDAVVTIDHAPKDVPADVHDESLVQHEAETEEVIPSYFSDLVLEPCTHEGNEPDYRFCIHCGQPIHPII